MDEAPYQKKIVTVAGRGTTVLYKAMIQILFFHRQLSRHSDKQDVEEALDHLGRSYEELIAASALMNTIFHREIGPCGGEHPQPEASEPLCPPAGGRSRPQP